MKLLKNLRLGITSFPVLIFSALIIIGFFNSKAFVESLWTIFKWLMINFGWLTDLGCLAFVLTLVVICFHPLGKVRLGGPDAKPTFSTWNWWAISLCAGIGTGIVYWGSVEPLKHAFAPAAGMGLEAGSDAAIIWAMRTSFLHWTFTPYAIYTIPAVAIGLAYYNMKKRYSVSSGLTLLNNGQDLNKTVTGIVDGITLFAICGGVARFPWMGDAADWQRFRAGFRYTNRTTCLDCDCSGDNRFIYDLKFHRFKQRYQVA